MSADHLLPAIAKELKLVLLDRDGVLNMESADFIKSPAEWQPLPGVFSALAQLQTRYTTAVCTNQSGIARGLFDTAQLQSIHAKLQNTLIAAGGKPIDIYFCPHGPDDHCQCRKPLPGLLEAAMQYFQVSPQQTLFIGDSQRDLSAGLNAGCHVALVKTGNGNTTAASVDPNTLIFADLADASKQLLKAH